MGSGVNEAGTLYVGDVVHRRLRPKAHKLRYRVFSMLVDLDRVAELDKGLRLFSVDRFNAFSMHMKDFGPRDGTSLAAFARKRAMAAGVTLGSPPMPTQVLWPRPTLVVWNTAS